MSFDRAGTVGQSQPVTDGSVVGVEASDEAMQVRQIICRDGRHPRVQLFAKASGEHLRKRSDMPCSGLEMWAAGENLLESDLLVVSEVVGVTQHPGGDPPDLRNLSSGRRSADGVQGPQVVADGTVAAAISQCLKFFVKCSSGGTFVVETLVQVDSELVQHSGLAGPRRSQQFIDTARIVETADGLPCQSELPCDRIDSYAFVLEICDRFESAFRANGEYRVLLTGGVYLFGDYPQLLRRGAFDRRFKL